jgi:hypothetical protein
MKTTVFWDVTPCGSCKNRCFGGTYRECRALRLLVTTNIVPSSLILVILMMGAIRSSKTSVLTRATRRHIPEVGILHTPLVSLCVPHGIAARQRFALPGCNAYCC